jgi:hypothetical protein
MKNRRLLINDFEPRSVLLIAAWVVGAAGAAYAQEPAPTDATATDYIMAAGFRMADKDNDGQLTRLEAAALPSVIANFDLIDTNHDNTISWDEFVEAEQE